MTTAADGLPFGLTSTEEAASARKGGRNILSRRKRAGFLRKYLSALGDPIIKILLVALAINMLLLLRGQGWFETAGIALAAFLASFLSTLSEYGSESAFLRLQEEASRISCRVRRDGMTREVPIDQLVQGDIVLLGAGESVPSDGMLRLGTLAADQAALNGESEEAEKCPSDGTPPEHWSPENEHLLFRGSNITSGEGVMEVLRVGDDTLLGSMAQSLQEEAPPSPLKQRLEKLAKIISRFGYAAAAAVAAADMFYRLGTSNGFVPSLMLSKLTSLPTLLELLLHAAMLAIGVVIVAVPEGLPMMITVVLSRCMGRMQKDGVMVRRLTGVETAGSLNILFTDKTGTLTEGRLAVESLLCGDGSRLSPADLRENPALMRLVGLCCVCCSGASWTDGKAVGGNATDRALLRFARPLYSEQIVRENYLPFDSARKYTEAHAEGTRFVVGSPDLLLPQCVGFFDGEGNVFSIRRELPDSLWRQSAGEGRRVVCLCAETPENGLSLLALTVIRDNLRPETRAAVRRITGAGVQLVMVTGDSPETAAAIARDAGILRHGDLMLTSAEMNEMTDRELQLALPRLRVVARALPTDKKRLVRVSQQLGMVAGMTGDGVNDAPALKLADVGFAMGSGTQVAKDAGDMVILSDDLASIGKAILYGRTIFRCIQRFLVFQLTMNFCAVGVSLVGPFIGIDTPVTVIQMLWINLIMDTMAGLAFAGEPPQEELMDEPPKARDCTVLTPSMAKQIAATALYSVTLCVAFLKLPSFRALFSGERYMTAFFALFVFAGIFCSFCARSEHVSVRGLRHNPSFIPVMALAGGVQLLLIYFGGTLFRTAGLSSRELFWVLCFAASVVPADILRKLLRLPTREKRDIIHAA